MIGICQEKNKTHHGRVSRPSGNTLPRKVACLPAHDAPRGSCCRSGCHCCRSRQDLHRRPSLFCGLPHGSFRFRHLDRHALAGTGAGPRYARSRRRRTGQAGGGQNGAAQGCERSEQTDNCPNEGEGVGCTRRRRFHGRLCYRNMSARPAAVVSPLYLAWIVRNVAGKGRFP